jgi:hypothetical protein
MHSQVWALCEALIPPPTCVLLSHLGGLPLPPFPRELVGLFSIGQHWGVNIA